jgi:toxin ParE1/3/4
LSAALAFYAASGGERLSVGFAEAFEAAARIIAEHPGIGASTLTPSGGIAGLRSRRMRRFPYLIFYVEQPQQIDILRVLHAQRDLPKLLQNDERF